jgi:hypothetical protein
MIKGEESSRRGGSPISNSTAATRHLRFEILTARNGYRAERLHPEVSSSILLAGE